MNSEDQKIIDVENNAVSQLLGGLKRVEAPGDFDFRVKARIANGRPVDVNVSWVPAWVRFAVPLMLFVAVGSYFGYRALYVPAAVEVETAAEVRPSDAAPINPPPVRNEIASVPVGNSITVPAEPKPSVAADKVLAAAEKPISRGVKPVERSGAGSIDMGQNISRPTSLKKPKDIERSAGIPAKDVLFQLGIDADYSSSSWRVSGVRPNSMAERSGLRPGDVIDAINTQNLTEKTTLPSPFNGKSISVRREGKSLQIELKP